MWRGSNGAITRPISRIVNAEKRRAEKSGVVGVSLRWHDCLRHGQVTASLTVARRHIKQKQHGRTVALPPHARTALVRWYQEEVDVERHLHELATYLGHVKVSDTYWYLSATPELLGLAARRLEQTPRRFPL